jgi:hypothetical protein
MNDSFDFDTEYDYDVHEFDFAWPSPNRKNPFPNLNFLKKNNFQPMSEPEPLQPWVTEMYDSYMKNVVECEKVKKESLMKVIELEDKIKAERDKEDNTYASKWSSKLNATASLINRLQDDLSKLTTEYREKVNILEKLHDKNKSIVALIQAQDNLVHFCKEVKKEKQIKLDELNRMFADRS